MSRPLRIAFLLGTFPVISETFILRQITGLLDQGHDVRIFANARPEASAPIHSEIAKYDLLNRTTYVAGPVESVVWELPMWPLGGRTWSPGATKAVANWRRFAVALPTMTRCLCHAPGLTRQLLSPREYRFQAASWSGLYRLATLCRVDGGFDVLHAHFGPVGNSFRFARELWSAPLVVSFHGYDFSTLVRKQGSTMYEKLFESANAITINSEFTRSRLEKLGCPSGKMRKLPVGLDPSEFPFRERTLHSTEIVRLLTVARLNEIKGHEFCLRAVAELQRSIPALRYDVVGDGPLRKSLELLAAELHLKNIVVFHGARTGAEIKGLLAQAHLFLLCSVNIEGDQEGQGLSLQEAQACGLPVIATKHGALPEGLLDKRSGVLVPERDIPALAEALEKLIKRSETWGEMGRVGRAFVEEHYDIRKLNANLVRIYTDVMNEHRTLNRELG